MKYAYLSSAIIGLAIILAACSGSQTSEVQEMTGNSDQAQESDNTSADAQESDSLMSEADVNLDTKVEPMEPGDPVRGANIFEFGGEKYPANSHTCIHCHSLDGSEGFGPTIKGVSKRAGERVPGQTAEEYLRQSILDPGAYLVEGFDNKMGILHATLLSDEEMNDLIAFMLTQ